MFVSEIEGVCELGGVNGGEECSVNSVDVFLPR